MKIRKLMLVAVAGLFGVAAVASAVVVTNSIGQLVTYTVGNDGTIVSEVSNTQNTNLETRLLYPLGEMRIVTSAASTASGAGEGGTAGSQGPCTKYTPADIGEILVWTTSNYVYLAVGPTTNQWLQLK